MISQVAQLHFQVPTVIARLLDPARAQFYAARGLRIADARGVTPLTQAARSRSVPGPGGSFFIPTV